MEENNSIMLEVSDLKKRFGDDVVLDGVDLTVSRGEVVVILGSSGCGKSTLLRCINGLEPIDGGSILIDGEAITPGAKNLTRLRQKIGMVFQSYDLFPHKNILDNVTLAPIKVQKRTKEDARTEAEQLLRSFSGASDCGKSARRIPASCRADKSSASPSCGRSA